MVNHPHRGRRIRISRVRNGLIKGSDAIGRTKMLPDDIDPSGSISGEIFRALARIDEAIRMLEGAKAK